MSATEVQTWEQIFAPKHGVRIVAISDTHGFHRDLSIPKCDILIHAGDYSIETRSWAELIDFSNWFKEQPAKHKILVPGNHDFLFEENWYEAVNYFHGCTVLTNDYIEAAGEGQVRGRP